MLGYLFRILFKDYKVEFAYIIEKFLGEVANHQKVDPDQLNKMFQALFKLDDKTEKFILNKKFSVSLSGSLRDAVRNLELQIDSRLNKKMTQYYEYVYRAEEDDEVSENFSIEKRRVDEVLPSTQNKKTDTSKQVQPTITDLLKNSKKTITPKDNDDEEVQEISPTSGRR